MVNHGGGLETKSKTQLEYLAQILDIRGCTKSELYDYTLDILCLMALADAFGFEYGEFVN